MRADAFADWAEGYGGLKAESACSYASYLASVEAAYGIELDGDWRMTGLARARSLLGADRSLNRNIQRNRLSALRKYDQFCSATSG